VSSQKFRSSEVNMSNQPRHELLLVAETVAREKGIEREDVIAAMEQAIQKAAKAKYGMDRDIRAVIDRTTGEVDIQKCLTVVDEVQEPLTEILLSEAKERDSKIKVGDVLTEMLPPIEFGRVAAQSARQVIFQKVRDAERAQQYIEYKDRIGQIISGLVKRVEFGNVVMDLGRTEAILRREDTIPRETFRVGDRIRVYIADVRPEARGPMIFLSRTHPQFMMKLFEQEVPEIYDGIIEVKAVARDPGSRAKLAVYTTDPSIDPVGACVGMRGSRVQAVVSELQGEKVDIIPWSSNPATFVVNAFAPAEIIKVVLDENVRLGSQLTGWNIDILTEAEETTRRTEEHANRTKLFMETLDVDEMIGQLLASEGFATIEEIAYVPITEFANIEGFDEEISQELQSRALTYLDQRDVKVLEECKELGLSKEVMDIDGLTSEMLLKLVKSGVKSLDDFADLAGDELVDIVGKSNLPLAKANEMIMAARSHWFEDEKDSQSD
jgi:N utilization substance protein A